MRHVFAICKNYLICIFITVPILAGLLLVLSQKPAYAANPTTLNFQGKVVDSNGLNVTNGTYSFIFRLYDNSSPTIGANCNSNSQCWWEETQGSVTVTNGVFQVELGSVCAFTSACNSTHSGIDWNTNNALYLTMKFNGDTSGSNGFMTPVIHLTTVPYAFNADKLGGIAASGFIQNNAGAAQSSSSFHIDGTGIADVQLQSPLHDTATSNGTLGIGSTNAGAITLGNVTNSSFLFRTKQVATAFQVQNASGNELLTIDTSATEANNLVRFGKASTINGRIVFNNATNSNIITIVSGATAASGGSGYTLTLPTTGGSGTQCLQSTSGSTVGATVLTFGGCAGGSSYATIQDETSALTQRATVNFTGGGVSCADNAGSTRTDCTINPTLATTYGDGASQTDSTIVLDSTRLGVRIQDAASTVGALFSVQKTAAGANYFSVTNSTITMQDNSGNNAVLISLTSHEIQVCSSAASYCTTNYASIAANNTSATFKSNTGTTTIGNGSGDISLTAGAGSKVDITANAASTWKTTAGNLTLDSGGGTIVLSTATTTIQKAASALTLDVSNGASNSTLTVSNTGGAGNITLALDSGGSFAVGASTGTTASACSAGQFLTGTLSGGIVTSGSCGGGTLQNAYDASSSPATITQTTAKGIHFAAGAAMTDDQLTITNSGFGTSTTGMDGLAIDFSTAGTTNSADNAGLKIDVTSNNNGTTTTLAGLKIGDLSSAEANSTESGLYVGTGWDIGLNLQSGVVNLAGYTSGGNPSDPSAPASDNLKVYAKKISGRMLLKFIGPSGVDSPFQPALFGNNIIMYTPTSGTTVTGGFGTLWAKGSSGGTVSTPTPTTTAPAITNQMHRTRHQNVVTTTNQVMGIQYSGADGAQFWRGNAAGLGGFFFNARFDLDSYPASTIRIFAGLASSTTGVVASDTVSGDVVGLWHDTTDPASGANSFNLVTRNNATTTKTSIALSNALAAGNAYDFFMFAKPNDTVVYYRLDDLVNGVTYEGNTGTNLPRNTIFLGPQVEMSNGTANTTVGTTAIGVNRIYIESDH